MADPHDELLPLFLAEAEDRLDRLVVMAPMVETDEETARSARRELHALKGASRMMGLIEVSELCHEAEAVLDRNAPELAARLVELLDRVSARIAGYRAEPEPAEAVPEAPGEDAGSPQRPAADPQLRVGTVLLDRLADRSGRMRVLTAGAAGLTERLFELSRLAERGVADHSPEQVLATLAAVLRGTALELEVGSRRMRRLVDHQVDTLQGLQLQPVGPFLLALGRHARELAQSLGKQIRVEVEARGGELDRRVLAAIEESLLHLVRNAVGHGIEPPGERCALGKPDVGTVRLEAYGGGGRIRIVVSDDGGGIDPDRVVAAALQRGVIEPAEAEGLDAAGALRLLLRPGMTTREAADQVSGRGVGLDAVGESARVAGGEVSISSEKGRGTTVTLVLPAARQSDRVVVVTAGTSVLGVPATAVGGYRHLGPHRQPGAAGEVRSMAGVLGVHAERSPTAVRLTASGRTLELAVTSVLGIEDVVLRPLPPGLGAPAIFTEMALIASGRPIPVVSPQLLVETVLRDEPTAAESMRAIHVLLVDDSAVTREMLRRLLEDGGFDVHGIGDAEEALRALSTGHFDCLVTDIEMPGMDGLELTRRVRAAPSLAQLPVIVVSTRNRPEDHRAGLDAGADAYLSKQGLRSLELIALVRRLGGG